PNLVVLESYHPVITVPHEARLDKPTLLNEDAETIQARRDAVMDPDFLDLGAVPSGDAGGTPVGDDPFDRYMGSREDARPESPDDPRPPQEAVVLQHDPRGGGVDAEADDGKAVHVDRGVGGEDQTTANAGAGGDVIDEGELRVIGIGDAEVRTR